MSENLVQFAKVVERRGEDALVRLYRPAACSGCHACDTGEGRNETLVVKNPIRAAAGEAVRIEMAPSAVLRAALLVYALPLLMLAAGYTLGLLTARVFSLPWPADTVGIAAGLASLVLSFGLLRLVDNRVKATGRFEPVISAVVAESEAQAGSACHTPARQHG